MFEEIDVDISGNSRDRLFTKWRFYFN